ncbi:conserved exported protein of unknown function [Petrocella atlantisensis]|uniref:Uncharacterized protein n=1 Tax=Petrocella atlantisensis TaxID=2173034 RepID=A0A3P7PGI2_9FIRM|nr:hypothetical protein [Petrocella atlantisensis]VDN48008.1 conserved exported protein of unknown function [Petrocella atlantisensis]
MFKKMVICVWVGMMVLIAMNPVLYANNQEEKEIESVESDGLLMVHLSEDGVLQVYMDSVDLKLTFDRVGINGLYGLSRLSLSKVPQMGDYHKMEVGTDWISPYMMRALDMEDLDSPFYTGGWHGSNGDDTGEITAYTDYVSFYVDSHPLYTDTWMVCKSLTLQVVNQVQAYNDDTSTLEEIITYTIENDKVDIQVDARANKPLEITQYFGLQTQNSWWDSIRYYDLMGTYTESTTYLNSYALPKNRQTVHQFQLRSSGLAPLLTAGMLTDGLGSLGYLQEDKPTCFTRGYGKTYFNLISGKPLLLDEEDHFTWRGFYQFEPSEPVEPVISETLAQE